jgi:BlaI family transcriptional regulator, penicillinase repressor
LSIVAGKRNPTPLLTRAEAEVMNVLWTRGGASVHDVADALPRRAAYTTVLTVLRILEKKGHVVHAPHPDGGRAHWFRPSVTAGQVRRGHVRDLIERLFGGRPEELALGLLEEEYLSREELESLRAHIDEKLGGSARGKGKR